MRDPKYNFSEEFQVGKARFPSGKPGVGRGSPPCCARGRVYLRSARLRTPSSLRHSPGPSQRMPTLSRIPHSLALAALCMAAGESVPHPHPGPRPPCAPDNAGLTLPPGFCAVLVAEGVGSVRHLAVASNGDVLAAERSGEGVLVLRDTDGDGKTDLQQRFGPEGGSGIALAGGYLYLGTDSRVVRWRWHEGQVAPDGPPETVIDALPTGGHTARSLAMGPGGALYVNIGSRTNSCQESDRGDHSPGKDPCRELEERAGIWRFQADRLNQRPNDGTRFSTGIRNAVALALQPGTDRLFFAMNGRDQLGENWGYSAERNAALPAEEMGVATQGADFGWPYCYYDGELRRKVLAPDYGGDGKSAGRCADKENPVAAFPAHWAPLAIAFYTGTQFPSSYRGGAFIAFHGSWNRSPLPQEGYRIVFVPFDGTNPTGDFTTFASLAGAPTGLRASGVAVGPDGSLYIAADRNGKIWRIFYGS